MTGWLDQPIQHLILEYVDNVFVLGGLEFVVCEVRANVVLNFAGCSSLHIGGISRFSINILDSNDPSIFHRPDIDYGIY